MQLSPQEHHDAYFAKTL